uniref:Uncharacterized protein n=1 Tax=Biomphalaria glabrata TaxID=6526 RepID=A0A2C9LHW3_BIOGL
MTSVTRGGSHIGSHADKNGGGAYHQNHHRLSNSSATIQIKSTSAKSGVRGASESNYKAAEGNDARSPRSYEQGARGSVASGEIPYGRSSRHHEEITMTSPSNGHSSNHYNSTTSSRIRSADRDHGQYSDNGASKRREDGAQRTRHAGAPRDDDIDRYFTLQHESKSSSKKGNSLRRSTSTDYENPEHGEMPSRRCRDKDHDSKDRRRSSSQTRNPEWTEKDLRGQPSTAYSDHRRSSKTEYDYRDDAYGRRSSEMSYRDTQAQYERRRSNAGQSGDGLRYHDDGSRSSLRLSSSRQSLESDSDRYYNSRQKHSGSTYSVHDERDMHQGYATTGRRSSNVKSYDYATLPKASSNNGIPIERTSVTNSAVSSTKSAIRSSQGKDTFRKEGTQLGENRASKLKQEVICSV